MAQYRTKYFGINASVDAVSMNSADEQLEWLLKDNPCFCADCREVYYVKYSIRLLDGYATGHITCTKDQAPSSNTRFV